MNLILSSYIFTLGFLLTIDLTWSAHGRGHSRHSRDDRKTISVDEGGDAVVDCIPIRGSYSSGERNDGSYGDPNESIISTDWKKDGKPLNIMDNPRIVIQLNHSLVIKKVTASDDGHYQCFNEFVNPNGGGGRIIRLRVKEKLKFIDPQKDKKLELNSVSKLHCKTRGHLPQTVTWIKNGFKFLPDHIKQERGTLMFNGVLSTDAGRYTCIASDSLTTINSTVSVEVVKSPKFTKKPAKYVESEVGSFVELHCAAEGDPAPIIHWEKNKEFNDFKADHRITTYPNGSLLISNFQQKDEGKYGCIAGNSAGLERAEVNLAIGTSSSSVRSANGYSATSTELEGDDKMTKTILITGGVVTLYMVFVLILMIWCRYRTAKRKAASMLNHNGNKPENGDLEMKERKSLTSQ